MAVSEIKGADGVIKLIAESGKKATAGVQRGMREIVKVVAKKAFDYAPRSPTRTIASATLKRNRRSKSQRMPGGLEKSIRSEVLVEGGEITGSVFIAANSPAGKYAKRIHDEKGKTWWKRGPGTRAKGDKADEKFVERAIEDSRKYFQRIMENEMQKELKRL